MDDSLEGWYTDPYALHEARWMSQGTATALVRDGEVEGHDPPPDGPFTATPTSLSGEGAPDGRDLRRADDAGGGSASPQDTAWDVSGEVMG